MSYQIKFKSKEIPDITINNQKGDKLKQLWFNENLRYSPVEIAGSAYLLGDIKSIIKISDLDDNIYKAIESHHCHGQYSIQNEINHIAKELKDWSSKIRDKKWREETRQYLWTIC